LQELFTYFSRSVHLAVIFLPVVSAFVSPARQKIDAKYSAGEVFVRLVSPCDRLRNIYMVALTLLLSCLCMGQQEIAKDKAAIHGTVTDQTQAVVPGASVVLSNTTGFRQETRTDDKGAYSFSGLSAGIYTVVITAPNFALKTLDYINVSTSLELTLDAPLEPASARTEVNVESSGVGKVETETASVSGTITEKEVVSLGLNGRNFTQLIALAPGVSN
jgi:hypothetical protein